MVLTLGLTTQELRVLQEFRRLGRTTLSLAEITAIKHPAGGGDAPASSLVEKGYLASEAGSDSFSLTERATPILSYNPAPEWDGAASEPTPAAEAAPSTPTQDAVPVPAEG